MCNIEGMRRALAGLTPRPGYVLTDGFPVRGLAVPALAMWKGDEVAACVAAASIVAKVTRDRIMTGLAEHYPAYGFAQHKGYSTRSHMRALTEHGPCPEHRASFANVMGLAPGGGEPPDGWQEDIPAEDDLSRDSGADRGCGADEVRGIAGRGIDLWLIPASPDLLTSERRGSR